ncbi:MAG: hypothetical protein HZA04_01800 [Nitrospinae bacterium]|nr:hypothetical protein [Nitrospinota bacterium]
MDKRFFLTFLILSLVLVSGSFAENKSVLTSDAPAKIAILGMGVYNVVGATDGLGALSNVGQETEATKDDKSLAEGFDFKEVTQQALSQYKAKLSGVRKWQAVSAKELGKDEAIAKFAKALKDNFGKIPGKPSEERYKRWTQADGLPFVEVVWVDCLGCGDYQKAVMEAAKQFCLDTGMDGVWLQSLYLGYGTKGASKFFSSFTGGSGQGTAIVSAVYVLIDRDGQLVASSGKTAEEYRSEESFMMVGGTKTIDKEMMRYELDAIGVSAKEISEKVGK